MITLFLFPVSDQEDKKHLFKVYVEGEEITIDRLYKKICTIQTFGEMDAYAQIKEMIRKNKTRLEILNGAKVFEYILLEEGMVAIIPIEPMKI